MSMEMSMLAGGFAAWREDKRQDDLRALAKKQQQEARQRSQQTIAKFRGEMSSVMRMARLALGSTKQTAQLRTGALEASARQQRAQQMAQRGGTGSVLGDTLGGGDFGRYLQTEGAIGQQTQAAVGRYTGLTSQVASTTAQMRSASDAEQTALGSQSLQMQSQFADPWGAFAGGMATQLADSPDKEGEGTESAAPSKGITANFDQETVTKLAAMFLGG